MLRTRSLIAAALLALLCSPAGAVYWYGRAATLHFGLVDASDGSAVTSGTVAAYITADGGTQASVSGSATHEGNGQWSLPLSASEMQGGDIGVLITESGSVPVELSFSTVAIPPHRLYVDPDNGSDSNDGLTPDFAFETISAAVSAASAGDTIYLDGGTHTISGSLAVPSGVGIVGQGQGVTNITGNPGSGSAGLLAFAGNNLVRDFSITATTQGNCIQTTLSGAACKLILRRLTLFGDDDCVAVYAPSSGIQEVHCDTVDFNTTLWDGFSAVATDCNCTFDNCNWYGSYFGIYALGTTQTMTFALNNCKIDNSINSGSPSPIKLVLTSSGWINVSASNSAFLVRSATGKSITLDQGSGGGTIVFHDRGGNYYDETKTSLLNSASIVQVNPTQVNTAVEAGQVGVDAAAIEAVTTAIGATGSGLSAMPWNASWDAEVQSEVNDGLTAYQSTLTAAIEASQVGTDAAAAAALSPLDAAGVRTAVGLASANLDTQLAALPTAAEVNTAVEAGQLGTDTAAILVDTGTTLPAQITGLSTAASPQLLQSTTIATLASQTSFTLTAGSADDDAYNGATVIVTDQSTSTQKAVGTVSDYTGSSKTVTLQSDPGVFTMAAGDAVAVLSSSGSAVSTADADLIAARVVAARGSYYPPRQLVWVLQRGSTGITVRDSLVIAKDKDETLKVWIDFAGLLGRNEAVETINSLTVSGGTATKVSSSEGITGNLVYLKVTGGADEDAVTVTYDVTTTEDQVLEGSVSMVIVDP